MNIINTPIEARRFSFKNRLAYPPIFVGKASPDGGVTDDTIAYYKEKTAGGYFALVTIEHSFISQEGKASQNQVSVASDRAIPGMEKLVRTIHENGTKVVLQMNHAGSCTESEVTGMALLGPSAVKNPRKGGVPKAMTPADIEKVTADFAAAAARGKQAGFDAVEIHSAHSYLLNQFYSPLTNLREDDYGGSLENRTRLHTEVIAAVRKAVGEDYPIFLRLGACDYMEGGNQVKEAVAAAKRLEAAGIDVLDVSGGMCGYVNPQSTRPGYFGEEAKAIKSAVNIPVITTGGVKEAADVEALLKDGVADVIGVGRTALTDSDWARKTMEFYEE